MDRRLFLGSSLAGATVAAAPAALLAEGAQAEPGSREFYELRAYQLKPERLEAFDAYAKLALVPALNRVGVTPVGVFLPTVEQNPAVAYVLLTHASPATVYAASRLLDDPQYQQAGADFLGLPPGDPGFLRVESSLLAAFSGWPKVFVPPLDKPRLFELRIYESPTERAGDKKVEMFCQGGEIAIFRNAGMRPVFFGQALAGPTMPNLTYMLVYDDRAERDRVWGKFVADPAWRKLSTTPGYTDKEVISRIRSVYLRPGAGSQL